MQYFSKDFVAFFKDLAKNNNKEWFHENKKRYEASVKEPFALFLNDLIAEIKKHDPELNIEAKDCIGRINRDIRFSKDKSPYNLHYTAFVSRKGNKDKGFPGLYLRFGADEVGIMAGCYGPTDKQLLGIRNAIKSDVDKFKKLISDKELISKFGKIQGEENKRIPKEFQETFEKEPLIAKKQFYVVAMCDTKILTNEYLVDELMAYWHAAKPLNSYLIQAITQ